MNSFFSRLALPSFLLASVTALCFPANAATFTVSNLNDRGTGSLRQALTNANAAPDADLITFSSSVSGTLVLTSGELLVGANVSIQGPGRSVLTLSGNDASRIFNVQGNGVAIRGLTLSHGRVVGQLGIVGSASDAKTRGGPAYGGALYNTGGLTLNDVAFANNSAVGGEAGKHTDSSKGPAGGEARGGAVFNRGTLRLVNVAFQNNSAVGGLGGRATVLTQMGRKRGGDGGPALGGALYNGGVLTTENISFQGNIVIGGTGRSDGYRGAMGPATAPDVRDFIPTATAASFSLVQERSFSVQLEGQGDFITYSATNLPTGLTLDRSTGVISGAVINAGQRQTARFTVSDGFRTSAPVLLTFNVAPAEAKSLVVTTLSDDGNNSDNLTSLREAIAYANAKPGDDTITFALPLSTTAPVISLTQGELAATSSEALSIRWTGAGLLTITQGDFGSWNVVQGARLFLGRIKISGFEAEYQSNIISNSGTLTLSECVVSDNIARYNGVISNTTSGTLIIDRSTLSGNSGYEIGAIENRGRLTLTNSTLSGNQGRSYAYAGAILSDGTLRVESCTIAANFVEYESSLGSFGSIYVSGKDVAISNSLIVGNGGGRLETYLSRQGLANAVSHSILDVTAAEAGLETNGRGVPVLKDNGGATPTIALLAGSPAIDAGGTVLKIDQRGLPRPTGNSADIGAFEYQSLNLAPKVESFSPLNASDKVGNKRTFSITVSDANGATDIKEAWLLINKQLSWNAGATLIYVPSVATPTKGQLFLRSGDAFLPAVDIGTNSSAVLNNGAVRVVASDVKVTASGNSLTLTIIATICDGLVGTNRVFARVVDKAGALDPTATPSDNGYRRFGNYSVMPQFSGATNSAPTLSGLTPQVSSTALNAAGLGSVQTFSFSVADADGAGDIESIWFSAGKSTNWTQSATFIYMPQTRRLLLRSDDGQSFLGGGVIGTKGVIENSQVRVDLSQVRVVTDSDGKTLTVTLLLQAKSGLQGLNKLYLRVQDLARATALGGDAQGYVKKGTWNVVASSATPGSPRPSNGNS